jgi:hypothetical protein
MAIILPNTFQAAVRSRSLLPFVGAGFSKNIDKELPDWSEVIKYAASILDYNPEILTLQPSVHASDLSILQVSVRCGQDYHTETQRVRIA